MKAFIYNGQTYIRLIPGKRLFQSTMVHDVVNRGDIFGMNIATQVFTIIPGKSDVEHIELDVSSRRAQADKVNKQLSERNRVLYTHFVTKQKPLFK